MDQNFDFTGLPLEEAGYILRRLGMRLIEELLAPPYSPGRPLPVKPPPELKTVLSENDINLLAASQVWKVKRSLNLKTGRISRKLREEPARALKKMIAKSLHPKGKLSARQWQIAACNRFALVLGGTAGDILPDDLWPISANAAWCNPDFQFSVALKINNWLRTMRLVVPYELPVAILSPITFWALISLARIKPLRFPYWFSWKKRDNIRVSRRIQQEAQRQMMRNEWAGFWDQWVIQLASQRWPSAFSQLDNRLCKALLSLPLLKTTANSALCRKKSVLNLSLWPLVERGFDVMDGIKRLPRSKKDSRRIALLNFAASYWEKQRPEFLTPQREDNRVE
jgi:hypothetical protein